MVKLVLAALLYQPVAPPGSLPVPPVRDFTAADLEAWLDGYIPGALAKAAVPGAVLVVVRDGRVLLQKGYGLANVATGAPVDPERTLFRFASVSKLFAWTAVMQQVERGAIDLDADINRYLDFPVPGKDGATITMRHLMTHSAGFEDALRGVVVTDSTADVDLERTLKRWVPARVFAPGTTPAYSNYATSLAGYIVQRVSGEPFERYVARHIFEPLGMRHSTFAQPVPAAMRRDVATGYADPALTPVPFEFSGLVPAVALTATGADLARFMIAHLDLGRLDSAVILRPETARLMQDTRFSLMAPLRGMALGFLTMDMDGRRIIGHAGDTMVFHSLLILYPAERTGFLISMNGSGTAGSDFRPDLFTRFTERYFPLESQDGTVDSVTAAAQAERVTGHYYSARGAHSNFLSFFLNVLGQVKVSSEADGTLRTSLVTDPSGAPSRLRPIGPYLWRQVGGRNRFGAVVEAGRVVRVADDNLSGFMVYERVPPSRSAGWLVPAMIGALVVLAVTALGWPVRALIRRRYRAPSPWVGIHLRRHRITQLAVTAGLLAVVPLGYIGYLASQPVGIAEVARLAPAMALLIQLAALIGWVGGLMGSVGVLYLAWKHGAPKGARVWSGVVTVAFLVLAYVGWVGRLYSMTVNF